ncbi:MAG TPA: GNAT family N-acetyltransferase [Vicinamibacterales bacterium]
MNTAHLEQALLHRQVVATPVAARTTVVTSDWREALPVLHALGVTVRELRHSDAATLFAMLTPEEVARFITVPPSTVEGFERFIAWTARQRAQGASICYGIVPQGLDTAVGLIQVRALEPSFATAEWGFAIGSSFWGRGVFVEGAKAVINFALGVIGVHRLEARASVSNGRGNGVLRKLGAVEEGILRQSFRRGDQAIDQTMWAIVDDDWFRMKAVWGPRFH